MAPLLWLNHSPVLEVVVPLIAAAFLLIALAHAFLGLLRNIDDYRANRPQPRG